VLHQRGSCQDLAGVTDLRQQLAAANGVASLRLWHNRPNVSVRLGVSYPHWRGPQRANYLLDTCFESQAYGHGGRAHIDGRVTFQARSGESLPEVPPLGALSATLAECEEYPSF